MSSYEGESIHERLEHLHSRFDNIVPGAGVRQDRLGSAEKLESVPTVSVPRLGRVRPPADVNDTSSLAFIDDPPVETLLNDHDGGGGDGEKADDFVHCFYQRDPVQCPCQSLA